MANRVAYAEDHFIYNRRMLQRAGLWMPEYSSALKRNIFRAYAIFSLIFANVWFTSSEFISFAETKSDLPLLIKNINFALTHLMGAFKFVYWLSRGKHLQQIMAKLEDSRWHYDDAEGFYPGKISHAAKRLGKRYSLGFVTLAGTTLSSSYIPNFYAAIFNPVYVSDGNGTMIFAQTLPYFSWIPFRHDSPNMHLIALVYQALAMWLHFWCIIGMDTLFMNIMNYMAMHLMILKGAFRTIRERAVRKLGVECLESGMKWEMKKCSQHLQTVLTCCEELEESYTFITFGQMLSTLFILCTSLFLISITPPGKQFASEVLYIAAICFQLVLYCWFGNKVTVAGIEMPDALWEGEWLDASLAFKSSMMITMMRMQKPLYFTAGGFAPLTLPTFVAIIKGSYSFFAFLKKVDD